MLNQLNTRQLIGNPDLCELPLREAAAQIATNMAIEIASIQDEEQRANERLISVKKSFSEEDTNDTSESSSFDDAVKKVKTAIGDMLDIANIKKSFANIMDPEVLLQTVPFDKFTDLTRTMLNRHTELSVSISLPITWDMVYNMSINEFAKSVEAVTNLMDEPEYSSWFTIYRSIVEKLVLPKYNYTSRIRPYSCVRYIDMFYGNRKFTVRLYPVDITKIKDTGVVSLDSEIGKELLQCGYAGATTDRIKVLEVY